MATEITKMAKGLKKVALAATAVVTLGVASQSFGALLVDFKAEPIQDIPEVQYNVGTPAMLAEDIGAIGDGVIGLAPGLSIETPFLLVGPGATQNVLAGTTMFSDVTMDLGGLAAVGNATTTPIGPVTLVTQQLGQGTFELRATGNQVVLLAGTIDEAVVSGLLGQSTGGVFSAKVNYQSGLIYNALVAAGWEQQGDLSWSLLDIVPALGVTGAGPTLNSFHANMVGQFSTPIPEPASLGLLTLAGLGLAARRRTR